MCTTASFSSLFVLYWNIRCLYFSLLLLIDTVEIAAIQLWISGVGSDCSTNCSTTSLACFIMGHSRPLFHLPSFFSLTLTTDFSGILTWIFSVQRKHAHQSTTTKVLGSVVAFCIKNFSRLSLDMGP